MPNTTDFRNKLQAEITHAQRQGLSHAEINAGELHRIIGGYPKAEKGHHSMPSLCNVMYAELSQRDEIVAKPAKGKGASLTIRYALPR